MEVIIGLDIDGVVSLESNPPTQDIVDYLTALQKEGAQIIFITGRSLHFAKNILKSLPFPFTLAVQNGALTLQMPSGKIQETHFMQKDLLPLADKISKEEHLHYVIYCGDDEDKIVWDPNNFDQERQEYLKKRFATFKENWQTTSQVPEEFTALKWIGKKETIERISKKVESEIHLHCAAIKDPFGQDNYVAQATHAKATKGEVLNSFAKGKKGVVIAAGDDYNDIPLLQAATIGIAMGSAPDALKKLAKVVADRGLVEGLKEAINLGLK